jgi:hypothetical protein
MWLLAFFQAGTVFGRLIKISACALALAVIYVGLVSTPPWDIAIAVSLAVLAALWVHGNRRAKQPSHASAECVAEIREDERRIRVVGGGVDFVLRLSSRTLNVNRVAKQLISNDAPGEFQRLRSGSFNWPFLAMTIDHEPRGAASVVRSTVESTTQMRWGSDEGAESCAAEETTGAPIGTDDAVTATTADTVTAGEREIAVYWTHPGHGDRLLFSTVGAAEKYEAIERAFSIFTAWIDQEDDARRAIERRNEVEAWQREWEANRLTEELAQERRTAEDSHADMMDGGSLSAGRRW